jgi:predicted membrane protein
MVQAAYNDDDAIDIERTTTGKRILFTILFAIIFELLKAVLACVVLFELVYSLITTRPPNARVSRLAHRMLRYGFEIGQYVNYNRDQLPFPFEDFPNGTEPLGVRPAVTQ